MDDKQAEHAWQIKLGDWEKLGSQARIIRTEVFLVEQQVPIELEWDDMDAISLHAVALNGFGEVLGTGRLLPDGHIGRMAVRNRVRGQGIGAAILAALLTAARQRGMPEAQLNAQTHAEGFYARFGFEREGEEFPDAGIPHIHMRLMLT